MNIYLFSILDNIHYCVLSVGIALTFLLPLIMVIYIVNIKDPEALSNKTNNIIITLFIISFFVGPIVWISSTFIPLQNSLIKSYICIKGKDQLSSGNINKIIKAIDSKSDEFIKAIKK